MILAKFIYFRLLGWKIQGKFYPSILKTVVAVVPHTSWHDFYIGVLVRKIIKVDINFVGKKELFDSPLGWYFKWMGGEPIERSSKQNKVDQIVEIFNSHKEFRMAIAPEGTRKKVEQWKSGFYYIAHKAKVPITPVAFDYKTKIVKIGEPFYTTGQYEKDLNSIQQFFKGVEGKIPQFTSL